MIGHAAIATHPSGRISPPSPSTIPAKSIPLLPGNFSTISTAQTQVQASNISVITVKQFKMKQG